jgi:hypothetical protein
MSLWEPLERQELLEAHDSAEPSSRLHTTCVRTPKMLRDRCDCATNALVDRGKPHRQRDENRGSMINHVPQPTRLTAKSSACQATLIGVAVRIRQLILATERLSYAVKAPEPCPGAS